MWAHLQPGSGTTGPGHLSRWPKGAPGAVGPLPESVHPDLEQGESLVMGRLGYFCPACVPRGYPRMSRRKHSPGMGSAGSGSSAHIHARVMVSRINRCCAAPPAMQQHQDSCLWLRGESCTRVVSMQQHPNPWGHAPGHVCTTPGKSPLPAAAAGLQTSLPLVQLHLCPLGQSWAPLHLSKHLPVNPARSGRNPGLGQVEHREGRGASMLPRGPPPAEGSAQSTCYAAQADRQTDGLSKQVCELSTQPCCASQ